MKYTFEQLTQLDYDWAPPLILILLARLGMGTDKTSQFQEDYKAHGDKLNSLFDWSYRDGLSPKDREAYDNNAIEFPDIFKDLIKLRASFFFGFVSKEYLKKPEVNKGEFIVPTTNLHIWEECAKVLKRELVILRPSFAVPGCKVVLIDRVKRNK